MALATLRDRPIRGVLFDWGDTLVRPPGLTTDPERHFGCVEAFFHEDLPERLPTAPPADAPTWSTFRESYTTVARSQFRETSATGREHSFEQRFARTLAAAFPTIDPLNAGDFDWMAARFGARIAEHCWPIANADPVLMALKQRFQIGLLSNYPHAPTVHRSLDRFGLLRHLDSVTVSGEIGWAKPHPRAFELAIAEMQVPPERLLYVGDDIVNDMEGAKALGLSTAWLPRAGQGGAHASVDVTLNGLDDLLALIPAADGPPKPS